MVILTSTVRVKSRAELQSDLNVWYNQNNEV